MMDKKEFLGALIKGLKKIKHDKNIQILESSNFAFMFGKENVEVFPAIYRKFDGYTSLKLQLDFYDKKAGEIYEKAKNTLSG